MKTKNFFLFLITLIILSGCSGAKDALQGKKRSDTSDEFLIEKKNPLTKPPDYNELPVPISEENSYTENNEAGDIEILLKKNKTNSTTSEQKNNTFATPLKTLLFNPEVNINVVFPLISCPEP